MKGLRVLAPLALGLALCGCGSILETAANSAGTPSPSKTVTEKVPPDLLIAIDRTVCRVPERRFKNIVVGQSVTCVWTGAPERPGGTR